MMTSLSAPSLPHDLDGVSANCMPLPATNGYHDDHHFAKEPNGFLANGTKSVKALTCSNVEKIKSEIGDDALLPFPLLHGENVEHRIFCNEASVILTNYRLFVGLPQSFHNIPVRVIDYVEMRELTVVHVHCKFGRVIRICLDTPEDCSELWRHITSCEASQLKTEDLFSFKYFTNFNLPDINGVLQALSDPADCEASLFVNDVKRMGFNTQTIWRTTEINSKFEVCKTYPKFHIVPSWVSDDDLREVAQFRSMRRFPSVVWRNKANGCVIARCSQPEVGWFGWRCEKDEHLLSAIAQAANLDSSVGTNLMSVSVTDIKAQSFLLVDARSYTTAVANRAKGGGCECQEYYPTCDIQFMGLVNIHAIRKSLQSVRNLFMYGQEQTNWYSTLEKTGWLHYLSALIRSTLTIVKAVDKEKRSAIVHCTDGWDRTTQLTSLAELLLDPYYRTIKGFCVLVEREWLEFGHKFADRCGHSPEKNINEISPVFFQWLDAVHQIMKQFPTAFQFNESFLIKLVHHVYSCLFGTFLCNSIRERLQLKVKSKTASIWNLLLCGKKDFINFLYIENDKMVLYPSHHIRNMEFWEIVFIGDTKHVDRLYQSDSMKSADFSDSGNFTTNSNESRGALKYSRSKNGIEISQVSNGIQMTLTTKNGIQTAVDSQNRTLTDSQLPTEIEEHLFEAQCCDKKTDSLSVNGNTETLSKDKELENDCDINLVNSNSLNSQFSYSDNCREKSSHSNSPEISSQSCSNNSKNLMNDKINENSMTDSVRTLTGELERPPSYDDSCLLGKVFQEQEVDSTLMPIDNKWSMRKVHSSPDSPRSSRLPRTKSVPDVMTASLCLETEIGKQLESNKQVSKSFLKDVSKFIDSDGLTIMNNYIHQKLVSIEEKHTEEIRKLQKRIQIERQARISLQQRIHQMNLKDGSEYSPVTFSDASQDDLLSLPDSVNGEQSIISSLSNDEGWEQVHYDDAQPTLWMPDHISSNCVNCGQQFSVVVRRHHCRKCGCVFCDACSDRQISVPDEQLYAPVRVCRKCYDSISHSNICIDHSSN